MPERDERFEEIILDHYRRPRNCRELENPTHQAKGVNPLCGDRFTVFMQIEGQNISEITFVGEGCALSKASASLMTIRLKGETVEEARRVVRLLFDLLDHPDQPPPHQLPGDLAGLQGLTALPQRVACATLAWHTFLAALEGRRCISSEDPMGDYRESKGQNA